MGAALIRLKDNENCYRLLFEYLLKRSIKYTVTTQNSYAQAAAAQKERSKTIFVNRSPYLHSYNVNRSYENRNN